MILVLEVDGICAWVKEVDGIVTGVMKVDGIVTWVKEVGGNGAGVKEVDGIRTAVAKFGVLSATVSGLDSFSVRNACKSISDKVSLFLLYSEGYLDWFSFADLFLWWQQPAKNNH